MAVGRYRLKGRPETGRFAGALGRDGSPSRPFAKRTTHLGRSPILSSFNGGLGEPALPPATPECPFPKQRTRDQERLTLNHPSFRFPFEHLNHFRSQVSTIGHQVQVYGYRYSFPHPQLNMNEEPGTKNISRVTSTPSSSVIYNINVSETTRVVILPVLRL